MIIWMDYGLDGLSFNVSVGVSRGKPSGPKRILCPTWEAPAAQLVMSDLTVEASHSFGGWRMKDVEFLLLYEALLVGSGWCFLCKLIILLSFPRYSPMAWETLPALD